mgnify:CR=1 FL=1
MRIIKSLESLGAFIFDNRVIDDKVVENMLSNHGVLGLLTKATLGNIVVYYIDVNKFRRKCIYEKCSMEDVSMRESCLRECLMSMKKEVIRAIIEALK